MILFVPAGLLVLAALVLGVLSDRRTRRRGGRNRDSRSMEVDAHETRRDLRAWKRASRGNNGDDLSWMSHRRR
ncbi:hypothetical protein ABZT17_07335 [Streptomyces sp. NPDC005648]|uniref:hypothetical protein n=1 Tax=Streptomyces sp. NPDC005648 TaxID=3157044 RepID=UPI0033AEE57E